jgi:hypothetical protein
VQINIPFQVKLEAVYLDTLRGCVVDKANSQA